jgi:TP901 family phage tail tape measure protein
MSQVGSAFVVVKPLVADFRQQTAQAVTRALGTSTVPLPITPTIPRGTRVSWKTLASGAAIPEVLPLPVAPTISPAAKKAFTAEVGGIRGALLGAGQFGASRALGISGPAAALFAFAIGAEKAVKSAATLEQELNVFQQVSGATADQMARVREEARRLGADISLPAVSAGDAAATMTELAKAGLSVDEVLNGTRGTLQLATAANLDFASSAELAAGALNAFQLPGNQAVKVADLLAGAANAAQGDIGDFGLALTQAGAVAHQAGLTVSETVTFLTELAKAGIAGSDAGTSLRVALLRLIAPTKEAKDIFKELGIEITDQAGNVRVDVFEQLRRSMLGLTPATRNAALATIFGTDAIRSAAIFTREGAAGFAEMERQVTRAGQAQEAADARTKGLLGSLSGLSSNLETLGTTIGTVALPLLTDLSDELSDGVTAANNFATAVVNMGKKVGGIEVGKFGTLGDAVSKLGDTFAEAAVQGLPFVAVSNLIIDKVQPILDALKPGTTFAPPKVDVTGTDAFGLKAFTKVSLADPELERAMAAAGRKAGRLFGSNVADAITKEERVVINAAKRTVQNAQEALREVVAEGAKAVEAAAVDAKQNLASIGQGLAAQVVELLDSGPLAQRIAALQARLDKSQEKLQKGSLQRTLRDAREELERAEASLVGGAPKDARQRAGEEKFLRPFQEKVKDAEAALSEFATQGSIDKLTAQLDKQKQRLQKTLDDLIAKFNAGLLSGTAVNAQVAALLQKNVGPMSKAGDAQGFAFRQAFQAQLATLQAQIRAIVGGPQTKKTGAEGAVVSPSDALATATARTAAAQRNVKDAVIALHRTEDKALKESEKQTSLLSDIKAQRAGPAAKPSSAVKTPRERRGPRQ